MEKWETSLNSFIKSRKIYSELEKISDKLEKMIYIEKIEQIDQSIRYCNHKVDSKG